MKIKIFNNTFRIFTVGFMVSMMACSQPGEQTNDQDDTGPRPVKTAMSVKKMVEQNMDFTGNVEPFAQYMISPSLQLRIEKIHAEVGDFVQRGQLLVQMDPTQRIQTGVQLKNLEKEYARLDTLFKTGSVSEQQLDQVKAELEVLQSSYQNLLENTRLMSPGNGVVTSRNFEDGDMYSMVSGMGILTVMQINPVKVKVYVPERFFPSVEKGMPVSLRLDVYPDTTFKGVIHLKYPAIDPATRTFTIEARFPNSDRLIRPGMFGRINIVFESVERVTVPDLAVQRQQGTDDYFVFVVDRGKVTRKVVTLGRRVDDFFEVINGLNAGEEVVVEGHAGLLEGSEVKVVQ
ncbi:efflux RND transporter periplasmic adaptor subunit [Thermophagus sp. OGC60D27]|uniref:efflux RND transporter periplasmic adaptor subunit n=1 Tax=Thermophagus sp. OGC60D27 TaxID=3458415 RepID=UPI0040378F6B